MKKTLVFGASVGGSNFMKNSQSEREYLAFVDNDLQKENSSFNNLKIISPSSIKNYIYDEIVVASYWAMSIKKQLICEYGIEEDKIYVPPKEMLMDIAQPFLDKHTLQFARDIISLFSSQAILHNIPLYINNGTLLGIVRDNDILSWDTDIDFAILEECAKNIDMEKFILNTLQNLENIQYKITKVFNINNRILSYKIDFKKDGLLQFPLSIEYMDIKDDFVIELVSLGQFKAPKKHILNLTTMTFNNSQVYIPQDVKEYLKYIYGSDWKTPKKNISFTDYNNYNQISKEIFEAEKIQQLVIYNTLEGLSNE